MEMGEIEENLLVKAVQRQARCFECRSRIYTVAIKAKNKCIPTGMGLQFERMDIPVSKDCACEFDVEYG
jgi:hypothetical protein